MDAAFFVEGGRLQDKIIHEIRRFPKNGGLCEGKVDEDKQGSVVKLPREEYDDGNASN